MCPPHLPPPGGVPGSTPVVGLLPGAAGWPWPARENGIKAPLRSLRQWGGKQSRVGTEACPHANAARQAGEGSTEAGQQGCRERPHRSCRQLTGRGGTGTPGGCPCRARKDKPEGGVSPPDRDAEGCREQTVAQACATAHRHGWACTAGRLGTGQRMRLPGKGRRPSHHPSGRGPMKEPLRTLFPSRLR